MCVLYKSKIIKGFGPNRWCYASWSGHNDQRQTYPTHRRC